MKPETPRDLALKILDGLPEKSALMDDALDDLFRRHSDLAGRDRAFISHLVQGVLRWRLRLDWMIKQASDIPLRKITLSVLNVLRLGLYQIFFMDRVPESAAVNEAVKQAKAAGGRHIGSFVNGVLRSICRRREGIAFPDRDRNLILHLSVCYSYPEWLVVKWVKEWGEECAESLLSAGNRIPRLTLRANTLKTERSKVIHRLAEEGVKAKPSPYSPDGILVEDFRGRVDQLKSFGEGLFQVQDEAAQIPSPLLDPRPGEMVLDVCAGFGGKATHLAERMGDKGRVLALDISLKRLTGLVRNSERLGIDSITPVAADAARSLSKLFRSPFDRIMVDAPCSGLGVISRHPDIKWNRGEKDVERLALLQTAILNESVSLLRKGGRIFYATCTLSREENEGVVKSCLARNPGMSVQHLGNHAPGWCLDLIDDQGFLRSLPHVHHMDGFFGALLEKT